MGRRVQVLPLLLAVVAMNVVLIGQQESRTPDQETLERVWQLTSHDNPGVQERAWSTLRALGCPGISIGMERGTLGPNLTSFALMELYSFVECPLPEGAWQKLRAVLLRDKDFDVSWQMEGIRRTRTVGDVYRRKMRLLRLLEATRPKQAGKQANAAEVVAESVSGVSAGLAAPTVTRRLHVGGIAYGYSAEPIEANNRFATFRDHSFVDPGDQPVSTISTDVDTSSYAWARGYLALGRLPEPDSIRLEEFVNYFPYRSLEFGSEPIAVGVEVNESPWNASNRLVRIQLQARGLNRSGSSNRGRGPTNLVYLLDTSGSMGAPDRLGLLKTALLKLTDQLTATDTVSIVTYAGSERLLLDSATGAEKEKIRDAIRGLDAEGSTNGEGGLRLAYALARKNFKPGGVNRVILGTDGDYNVGVTGTGELTRMVEVEAKNGIALTGLGFGRGNYRDELMQSLTQSGNGNAYFIDSEREVAKVFEQELAATLNIAAKDTKVQVELNPAQVSKYRLLGYETRLLENRDFKDDSKDAGDLGAGHVVTVFYEVIPGRSTAADAMRFQKPGEPVQGDVSRELMFVKVRYKDPDGTESKLIEVPVRDTHAKLGEASSDFVFASAVATFAQALRRGDKDGVSLALAKQLAGRANAHDPGGYRKEFVSVVDTALQIRFLDEVRMMAK